MIRAQRLVYCCVRSGFGQR